MAGIDINAILNALPADSKPAGIEKLSRLVLERAIALQSTTQPRLEALIKEKLSAEVVSIIQPTLSSINNNESLATIDQYKQTALSKLETLDSKVCPTLDQLSEIINTRNNTIQLLKTFDTYTETLSRTLTGSSKVLTLLLSLVKTIKVARLTLNTINKAAPAAPGATTAAIEDLNELQNITTFDELGNSKLQKIKEGVDKAKIPVSIVSNILSKILSLVEILDVIILKCKPDAILTAIPQNLEDIKNIQNQINTSNDTLTANYNNFLIKIETVPFTNTVNRSKAVAYNQDGIPVLETELSFTTQPQLLIDQLKLKINSEF